MSDWIKIDSRLPDFNTDGVTDWVLVCCSREIDTKESYEVARFEKDGWDEIFVSTDGWNLRPITEFTHWMPLPEPPID